MLKSTSRHKNYWQSRKIDWNQAYSSTWNHPHRELIIEELKRSPVSSVFEFGCASGPNLYRIAKEFPSVSIGGMDINEDAISVAKEILPSHAVLEVGSFQKVFLSDKGADVVLTDMALIYIDPTDIKGVLLEAKRIARDKVIFCEFHSTSFIRRLAMRITTGYHVYNYQKLLEKLGFYDITIYKIPEMSWPGGEPQKTFGYIISARP